MVAPFLEIRSMIVKACRALSDSTDYTEKHHFTVNTSSLNNMFKQRGLDYHVMAGTFKLESFRPFVSDIHTIAEYVESFEKIVDIMDGYTQIAIFTVFSTHNKDGEISFTNDNDEDLTIKDMNSLCNDPNKLDFKLMSMILKNVPNYRIMVARRFHPKSDSFVYDVYFRSNHHMTDFYKSIESKKPEESKEN